jgi:hypothetical protein
VFVRPYPDVEGGRWQVSSKTASSPVWSRSSRELYFLDGVAGDLGLSAVAYSVEGRAFRAEMPKRLFSFTASAFVNYTVAPDGRFLFITSAGAGDRQQLLVVQNWDAELNARVPAMARR